MEAAFAALATAPRPVTLPTGPNDEPGGGRWLPIDQVRTLLAHPSCGPQIREWIWAEVAERAASGVEPWPTVALGMAVPMLRRLLSRAVAPVRVEAAELQQEALAAVAAALAADTTAGTADRSVGWERRLVRAADAARHRVYYRAGSQPPTVPLVECDGVEPAVGVRPDIAEALYGDGVFDAYGVLVRAVRAHAITMDEAQLIARTRLRDAAMTALAAQRGVPLRTLHRRRADAERRLAAFLRPHSVQDGDR